MRAHRVKQSKTKSRREAADFATNVISLGIRVIREVNDGEPYDYEQGCCLWCREPINQSSPSQSRPHGDDCAFAQFARLLGLGHVVDSFLPAKLDDIVKEIK